MFRFSSCVTLALVLCSVAYGTLTVSIAGSPSNLLMTDGASFLPSGSPLAIGTFNGLNDAAIRALYDNSPSCLSHIESAFSTWRSYSSPSAGQVDDSFDWDNNPAFAGKDAYLLARFGNTGIGVFKFVHEGFDGGGNFREFADTFPSDQPGANSKSFALFVYSLSYDYRAVPLIGTEYLNYSSGVYDLGLSPLDPVPEPPFAGLVGVVCMALLAAASMTVRDRRKVTARS